MVAGASMIVQTGGTWPSASLTPWIWYHIQIIMRTELSEIRKLVAKEESFRSKIPKPTKIPILSSQNLKQPTHSAATRTKSHVLSKKTQSELRNPSNLSQILSFPTYL